MLEYVLWIIMTQKVPAPYSTMVEMVDIHYDDDLGSCMTAADILMAAYRENAKVNPGSYGWAMCQEKGP